MTIVQSAPPRERPLSADREVAPAPPAPARMDLAKKLQWALRISMAGTYIGHGAFGIIGGGKPAWLPYFHIFGIHDSQAWHLMPLIGTMDITFGILILLWPTRAGMLHLAIWGVVTGLFRPLAGEGAWEEVFERGGNYAAAMALLVMTGAGDSIMLWFKRVSEAPTLTHAKALAMHWILRVGTMLLLVGHGGYGVWMHKKVWLTYFSQLGIGESAVANHHLYYVVGWLEILLGLAVLLKPVRSLVVFVCAYKIGTEALRPLAGENGFEFVERFGSYLVPLGLLMVTTYLRREGVTESRLVNA